MSNANNNVEISITVRAPNGATESENVRTHERVDKVTRGAVTDFVNARVIEAGDYDLALAKAGQTIAVLDPTKRLDEYAFDPATDVFHLIAKKPQVDG